MMHRTRRAFFSAFLFLAVCALAGSFYGRSVSAQSATQESNLRDSLHSFTDVYGIVEQNYAEHLDSEKVDKAIYDGAIPGMLHVLDPHSNFYDPKAYAQMREDQHGRYFGVGMSIQPQPAGQGTKIVVLAPMEGSPAFRAGLKPGDVILFVDGKTTENADSAAVASMLKGPRGTHVAVTVSREGAAKPLVFDLVRDEIPQYSVDIAFQIRPGIGYIHVKQFMETTSREVGDALDNFGDIHGLVIDLRGNPGGLLNEGRQHERQVFAERPDRRLAARSRLLRPGLPRAARVEREIPHRRPRQPQHSICGRDRFRRAAGPRPRAHRRRNHLWQRPCADRVSDQRKHRPRADHLPLLHAVGPSHPAQLLQRFALRLLLRARRRQERQEHPRSQTHRLSAAPFMAAAASRPTRRSTTSSPTTSKIRC